MPANAPTTLEQVFDKVVSLLEAITQPNGYRTTVGTVEDFDITLVDEVASDITLGVFVRSHAVDRNLTRMSHGIECPASLIVGIRAAVRGSLSTCDPIKKNLICDIKQALFSDFGLGFLGTPQATGALGTITVENIQFQDGGIQPDAAGAIGNFLASLSVKWLEDPSNP
jgi:hypothetical protein